MFLYEHSTLHARDSGLDLKKRKKEKKEDYYALHIYYIYIY